ncbi:MAG: hypothetical protein ACI4OR_03990 [Alphaproteobacteria bacterium]
MENNNLTSEKKNNGLQERLAAASRAGKKTVEAAKTAIKVGLTALTLGTGYHAYKQFHKSPEEVREETKINKTESKKIVEKAIQKDLGTNSIAQATAKVGGKIAETGAAHGGALRAWIVEKLQKTK